jgi:16S rRNA (guanine1207-N2)-methyltransferase
MPWSITTTDLLPPLARDEHFLGGALLVRSRSGLHPTEGALLERLPTLPRDASRVLVAGNRTGVLPAAIRHLFPRTEVLAHVFDTHHRAIILRTLVGSNAGAGIACVAAADIPREAPFDAAVLQLSRRAMPTELVMDLLEQVHEGMADGGVCLIGFEGDAEWLRTQIKAIFGKTPVTVDDGIAVACATRVRPLPRPRNFAASFEVSLPGVAPFTLQTRPGVFAHRRPDLGGLALAEVAAREAAAGDRVLDIGCGCGMVGIALARAVPGLHVTFLDSDARAVACAAVNAAANGLTDPAFECTDSGTRRTGFTLAVGNPPYFGDYAIAELFIRTARDALAPGGRCLIVAKQTDWHVDFMTRLFGAAERVRRRDYTVVRSLK